MRVPPTTESQWLADHGFAVLIVDGRGTPGRGPAFEHAVHGDLAGPALEDQLDALDAAALLESRLDLSRVGIRGWSYGGTLAALAALRRPDRIRCAVVGAPVTDWRLYDTHYTERYLGHPDEHPEAYLRSAVVLPDGRPVGPDPEAKDAPPAELLIVHGLVDDNVLAAHSLRLTEALHAAGHPFTFLPLTDATHMASDPQVAARLLEVQVRFLQQLPRGRLSELPRRGALVSGRGRPVRRCRPARPGRDGPAGRCRCRRRSARAAGSRVRRC
jgi:dipeptidyl-peptidase 4